MRYKTEIDNKNNCVTLIDEYNELKTDFGSEIILSPVEDSLLLIERLNYYEAVNKKLIETLEMFDLDEDSINEIIETAVSDLE